MVFLSSSCVKSNNVLEAIETLSPITKNIELSGGSNSQKGLLEALLALKNQGYHFLVHGYFPPPKEHFLLNFADESEKTRAFIANAVAYIKALGISYYSTHAGFVSDFTIGKKENLEGGLQQFEYSGVQKNIDWFFESFDGIALALENLFPNHGDKNCCFWMKPECIIDALNLDARLNLLLDLGHLKIAARAFGFSWEEACETLLSSQIHRIKEIHVSENGGVFDEHLPILESSFQIKLIEKYASEIKQHRINITVEARGASVQELRSIVHLLETLLKE